MESRWHCRERHEVLGKLCRIYAKLSGWKDKRSCLTKRMETASTRRASSSWPGFLSDSFLYQWQIPRICRRGREVRGQCFFAQATMRLMPDNMERKRESKRHAMPTKVLDRRTIACQTWLSKRKPPHGLTHFFLFLRPKLTQSYFSPGSRHLVS